MMSENDWLIEDGEFKDVYNGAHLTVDEFNRIRTNIISVGNGKLTDISSWEYFPYYRVFNQTRFTPMLINRVSEVVEKPLYISFNCDNCGNVHTHRDLETTKNKIKILCRDCTLTNRTFRLRKMDLNNGSSIMWQSVPERRFIEWCQDNSITVKNGPRLRYSFLGKEHDYRVDFELPDLNILIEIKDNHCWHQRQVISGKHAAKETAATNWCNENNYEYKIIFPKTNATIKGYILSKIL
jgi:predicted RNA-binding Zn-ribbon protein involved in translation (DUF1610 family)